MKRQVARWGCGAVLALAALLPHVAIAQDRGRDLPRWLLDAFRDVISESAKKIAKYDSQLRQIRDENDPKRLSLQGNRAQEEARQNSHTGLVVERQAQRPRPHRHGPGRRLDPVVHQR